jgi:radical SAM enzyme (TIGR01210 family)
MNSPERTSTPEALPQFSDEQILQARGVRNEVRSDRPYHWLVETERSAAGSIVDVATVFLTNKECPFRCLMCDLWKNTTEESVPVGAIPTQIEFALQQLPPAQQIKLYNSGNFFDSKAIAPTDHAAIAKLVGGFDNVIVENHPRLCDDRCLRFRDLCGTELEIAIGLETSHEPTLKMLNKQMTTDDFRKACSLLTSAGIRVRTFILLRPPLTSEQQGIDRAIESIRFAFDCGVNCCALIPTRPGNGMLDRLQSAGQFERPKLTSLETVLNETVGRGEGRVFADLWDAGQFADCSSCAAARIERLNQMNLQQTRLPEIECNVCQRASGSRG